MQSIANENGLTLLVLSGSRATGRTHGGSDTDVAYLALKPLSLEEENSLIVCLMQTLRTDKVDLASLRTAPLLLLCRIAKTGQALYERVPGIFSEF